MKIILILKENVILKIALVVNFVLFMAKKYDRSSSLINDRLRDLGIAHRRLENREGIWGFRDYKGDLCKRGCFAKVSKYELKKADRLVI